MSALVAGKRTYCTFHYFMFQRKGFRISPSFFSFLEQICKFNWNGEQPWLRLLSVDCASLQKISFIMVYGGLRLMFRAQPLCVITVLIDAWFNGPLKSSAAVYWSSRCSLWMLCCRWRGKDDGRWNSLCWMCKLTRWRRLMIHDISVRAKGCQAGAQKYFCSVFRADVNGKNCVRCEKRVRNQQHRAFHGRDQQGNNMRLIKLNLVKARAHRLYLMLISSSKLQHLCTLSPNKHT